MTLKNISSFGILNIDRDLQKINFNKLQVICSVLALVFLCSCTQRTQKEKDLLENINKTMYLGQRNFVRHGNDSLSYTEFRQRYNYLTVVYLKDGCSSCYLKFIEWQNKMDSLAVGHSHSVLFVIKGHSYEEFMQSVLDVDSVIDKYYTIMDADGEFLKRNSDIPRWMIDASMLVDAENKIKMVGAPYTTPQMTVLYRKICSQ